MEKKRFKELFSKWCNDTLDATEMQELTTLYSKLEAAGSMEELLTPSIKQIWTETVITVTGNKALALENEALGTAQAIDSKGATLPERHLSSPDDIDVMAARIVQSPASKTKRIYLSWLKIAAIFILMAGIGAVVFWKNTNSTTNPILADHPQDIQPGRSGAMLTLANGKVIMLDSMQTGIIAHENGAELNLADGQLHYQKRTGKEPAVTYNSIVTPVGRQFKVVLPDGTAVWLNAGSTLKYPTSFNGPSRTVALVGEAYFEVAANKQQPFCVRINNQAFLQVLGTSFNITAYEEEQQIKTTLLDGAVRMLEGNRYYEETTAGDAATKAFILKPGDQCIVTQTDIGTVKGSTTELLHLEKEAVDKVVAWKQGVFDFNGLYLKDIMRQLMRWYDFKVEYEAGVQEIQFYGKISKELPLSSIIRALKESKVKFRWKNEHVLVVEK